MRRRSNRSRGFLGRPFAEPGLYPIHLASQLGDLTMVLLLLEAGCDPETETSWGRTAVPGHQLVTSRC